jgi:hypothetical protein
MTEIAVIARLMFTGWFLAMVIVTVARWLGIPDTVMAYLSWLVIVVFAVVLYRQYEHNNKIIGTEEPDTVRRDLRWR